MRYLLVTLFILIGGCTENIYFSDDEGGPHNQKSATGDHIDELSLPYALGTSVGITMKGPVGDAHGWKVVSDAPAIFTVTSKINDDGSINATGSAMAEGDTRIRAFDANGTERRSAAVSVRAADHARLFSHGELRIVANDDPKGYDAAEVFGEVVVIAGGKGVLAVTYYKGTQRVYGRGIAQPSETFVQNMTSSGGATNEWLFVTPPTVGHWPVSIKQGARELATLGVGGTADVITLSLAEQQEGSRNDNDKLWVLARGTDFSGEAVLGTYCSWTLDGVPQKFGGDNPATTGDLFRYRFAPGGPARTLTATRGSLTANFTIHAHDGEVNDTTYLGCSTSSFRGRPPLLALVAVFLLLSLRKKSRRSGIASDEIQPPATNERGR
jgi:hypothetical protein